MPGPAVVGREKELTEVDAFLEAAGAGFAALVLEGEAGIGKTTVWLQAWRRAQDRGARVLWCRPSAAEAKLSFAAVADLLSGVEEEEFSGLPAPQREALSVALLRTEPTAAQPAGRAVAAGFLALVRALCTERVLVLAVDDWQWLDGPSRHVLEFTVRRLDTQPVGLLCSTRGPIAGPPLGGAVLDERLRRVSLGRLSLAALGQIIAARLGPLPRPLLVRISEASAGNPFYALEIARLALGEGTVRPTGGGLPVPDDLRKLTASRVRQLPAAAREAVLLAAVAARPDSRIVELSALGPAEEAGILTVAEDGRIEFVHPLFASAAYGAVPAARRRELHHLVASRVADPEQRARHLALGAERADAAVAAQLDEAAGHAASRGAPDAAAELAELAVRLTSADHPQTRVERLLRAARLWFDAGDLTRAAALADSVLAGSPPEGLRARALQLAAQVSARRSNFTEASEFARTALGAAAGDRRLCAAIELDLVYCAISLGDVSGAAPHARAAVAHAEATGETGILADALAVLTMAEFLSGRGLDSERLGRALELEDPLGASAFVMRPRLIYGMLQLWTGDVAGATNTLGSVYAQTIERGQEGAAPMLSLYLVWAQVWNGDFAGAAEVSAKAREEAALLSDPTVSGIALAASALGHAHDGHTELARAEAGQALSLFEQVQWRSGVIWPLWALGFALLSEGDPVAADAVLGPLAQQLRAMGPHDPVMAMFLPDEVEALIGRGELEQAEAYLEPFERSARELERGWAMAAAARCRGALHAARGEPEAAYAALELALAAHERAPMPFERARTLLVAGQVHRRFKQRAKARERLAEALAIFERLGAPLWAEKARAELSRVGRPREDRDELTDTERHLAQLAASGLSNRQVAERAFVSVKTVEANLTRVYRKLGVRSRVGLANALRAGPAAPGPDAPGTPGREPPDA